MSGGVDLAPLLSRRQHHLADQRVRSAFRRDPVPVKFGDVRMDVRYISRRLGETRFDFDLWLRQFSICHHTSRG